MIDRLANNHQPIVDIDLDKFSTYDKLRGSNWRGKDCNDLMAEVYPGRKETTYTADVDHNCNGIFGMLNATTTWEQRVCTVQSLGTVVLGDSAGAHFEIPPRYFNASEINSTTYSDLLSVLQDEFDWPHRSGYTAYEVEPKGNKVFRVFFLGKF